MTEQDKREKIITDTELNMFIEAGAGAGKTFLIVKRVINQLIKGFKPSEIVAITFTNAATRELKQRILREAEKRAENADNSLKPEEAENLRKALEELDQMQISTIHGFCHRILSEKMFDAHLPYGFRLMEEGERKEVREKYFRRWAEGLKQDDWDRLTANVTYRSAALDNVRGIERQLDTLPKDTECRIALGSLDEIAAGSKLQPYLDVISGKVTDLIKREHGKSFKDLAQTDSSLLVKTGKELKAAVIEGDLKKICKILLKPTANINSFIVRRVDNKNLFKSDDFAIKTYIESIHDDIDRIYAQYLNFIYAVFAEYGEKAHQYIRENVPDSVISNDGLLEKTRELLGSSEEILDYFRKKFRTIYVDEFQDTDNVQAGFIRMIASSKEDPQKLRDGALFIVGDPKQSIYRFRGAQPEVYFRIKEYMSNLPNAFVEELSDNYRSAELVVDWVNAKFAGKRITRGRKYVPMNAVKKLEDTDNIPNNLFSGIYIHETPEEAQNKDGLHNDVNNVCRLIRSLVDNKYRIPVYDNELQKYTFLEITFSDFLVLCMNTDNMSEYVKGFREYGIPFTMDGKDRVGTDPCLQRFVRMYAFLASPYDKASRLGAMEVLLVSGADDREKNDIILDIIREDTKEMSAQGLIRYLLDRPELYIEKEADIRECEILDMQKKIIQMTEMILTGSFVNKGALLDAMYDYCENNVEHELILEENADSVRFMNLHKAKGLEGNIVIWTNRTEDRGFKEGKCRKDKTYYPELRYKYNVYWTAYGGDRILINEAKAEDEAEVIRLEYVAATRAKQAVVFMDNYKKKSLFSVGYGLNEIKSSVSGIISQYKKGTLAPSVNVLKMTDREETFNERESLAVLKKPVYSSESPSDYEDENAGKTQASSQEENTGLKRPVGNIFGTTMHRTFELLVEKIAHGFDTERIKTVLMPSVIRQAVNENLDDIADEDVGVYEDFLKEACGGYCEWFLNSDVCRNAKKTYTELPFSYIREPETDGEPSVWMHGEADLVVEMQDGSYYVLDYKSDNDAGYESEEAFNERLLRKYSLQIRAYKEAVSRVFSVEEEKIRAALISFTQKDLKEGEKLRVRVTPVE